MAEEKSMDLQIIQALVDRLEFTDPTAWNILKRYKKGKNKDEVVLEDLLKAAAVILNAPLETDGEEDDIEKKEPETPFKVPYIDIQNIIMPVGAIRTVVRKDAIRSGEEIYKIILNEDPNEGMYLCNKELVYSTPEARESTINMLKEKLINFGDVIFL